MIPIFEKNNVALEQQIRNVEQQALENYDKKHNQGKNNNQSVDTVNGFVFRTES